MFTGTIPEFIGGEFVTAKTVVKADH